MTPQPARLAAALQEPGLKIPPKPALALGLVMAFAAAKLILHFVVTATTPYEIHRDEFLYLAMGQHLQLWKMDFPPAIALLAKLARFLFGDTLFAIRFFSAIGGIRGWCRLPPRLGSHPIGSSISETLASSSKVSTSFQTTRLNWRKASKGLGDATIN